MTTGDNAFGGTREPHGRVSVRRGARRGRLLVAGLLAGTMLVSTSAAAFDEDRGPAPLAGAEHTGHEHGTVDVDGIGLHYVRTGEGPPLVLLHGWPETWYHWNEVMPDLARTHTVLAFDLPGLGDSEIPEDGFDKATTAHRIRAAVRELGYEEVALMGHDLGAMVAYNYARDFPQEVNKLAVIEAPLAGLGLEDIFSASFHFQFNMAPAPVPEEILDDEDVEVYLGYLYDGSYRPDRISQEVYFEAYSDPAVRSAGYEYYRAFPEDAADNLAHAEPKIDIPVLAMGAEYAFGEAIPASFEHVADDVRPVIAPDAGHFVAQENPEFLIDCAELFFGASTGGPVPDELTNCVG
ncbi:alpha/beta fold hydrolase [Actinoalloteichus caeruleus]|uniref:alpha/beta fold hydrolase n=1 Tax=Actinoalloteichus cyanogriseus TaxID=2893586 RepID=UPI001B809EEA|nr:alpha/beta hydrolase [Actinoalloteichus caeruleus]